MKPALRSLMLCAMVAMVAGCAHRAARQIVHTPPSTIGIRAATLAARGALVESRGHVQAARTHIGAAQANAAALLRVSPVEARPVVTELQGQLAGAQAELSGAATKVDEVSAALAKSDALAGTLQGEIDRQTDLVVATISEKNLALDRVETLTKDLATQRTRTSVEAGLKWRWRGYCLGLVLLVAGFFVARQYLPFLKFI